MIAIPTCRKFTLLLNRMFEENFNFQTDVNFDQITRDIIQEIRDNLISLQADKQSREGLLINVFRGFFDNGKYNVFNEIHKVEYTHNNTPQKKRKFTDAEFNFLYDCLLCLRTIVTDISEECLIYDINLYDLIKNWCGLSSSNSPMYELFVFYAPIYQSETTPEQETPTFKNNNNEQLSDIMTHEKSVEIVEGVKIKYKNIRGKRLKLLLLAFQDLSLLPKERIASRFYKCCKTEFPWEIASYNAMNSYKFNINVDKNEVEGMKQYLNTLINTNQ